MRHGPYILALALITAGAASAQEPVTTSQGPVARLLAHRAELSLSEDQVRQLEAIDQKYVQQNREVVAKLELLRGQSVGQPLRVRDMAAADREQLLANRAALRPLTQQLRASHQGAISEARGVLNAEQNGQADQYLYRAGGQGQARGPAVAASVRGRGQGLGQGVGRASLRGQGQGLGPGIGRASQQGQFQGPGLGAGRANLRGQVQGTRMNAGRANLRGQAVRQGGGRGMMLHTPGTGQALRGGRGG